MIIVKPVELKIELPQGVNAEIEGKKVSLSSAGKQNSRLFHAEEIEFEKKDNAIILRAEKSTKKINAIINTVEAHLRNMIKGLKKEHEYRLGIVYSHFPMNVSVKGNFVEISNFAGEKKPRKARIFGTTTVQIKGKEIIVKGIDKEDAGQTAGGIENAAKVKGGKDKRVFQDGIYLVSKTE